MSNGRRQAVVIAEFPKGARLMKHLLLTVYLLIIFILFHAPLQAQQASCAIILQGRIIDSDTNLPVSGVNITLLPNNSKAISDGHGYYRISGLCAETYTIKFTSVGFDSYTATVKLEENKTLNVSLTHANIHLHDVKVVGHQSDHITTNISRTLSMEQLAESRGQTLGEALQLLPGVATLQTGNTISKPVINGLHSNRILLLNNGVRQEGQQWGTEHAPEIDAFIAKRLTVIKGAEGVQYGPDALGGVILVSPQMMPIDPHATGELHLIGNSNGRGGAVSGMIGSSIEKLRGLSWRGQGTFKRNGNLQTAEYIMGNTGALEYNLSGTVQYAAENTEIEAYYSRFSTELGILSSAHIGTIADIEARIAAGRPLETYGFTYGILAPRQEVIHDLGKIKLHKDLTHGRQLDVQYSIQRNHRQEYDSRRGDREGLPMLDMLLYTQHLDAVYLFGKRGAHQTKIGVNAITQVNNNVPGTLNTPLIPNFKSYGGGVFVIDRYVKDKFELEAGLRYDLKTFDAAGYDSNLEWYGGYRIFHNLSSMIGGAWNMDEQWQLRSNVGLAWRPPTANELYSDGLHHGSAVYEIGDPDLRSEQGYKWVTTVNKHGDRFSMGMDVYAQYIRHYIYTLPVAGEYRQSIRGTFPVFRYDQTNITLYGVDIFAGYQFPFGVEYQLNASIVRARDIVNNRFLPFIPSDRINHHVRWELPIKIKQLKKNYLKIAHTYVAEQTRYESDSDFAAPPPAYQLFAAHIGSTIAFGHRDLNVTLSGTNIFNSLYKEYMNRFRYYSHDMGRNISLKLAYTF